MPEQSFNDRVLDMIQKRRKGRQPAVPQTTIFDFLRNQQKGKAPIRFEPKAIKAPRIKKRSKRYPFLEI